MPYRLSRSSEARVGLTITACLSSLVFLLALKDADGAGRYPLGSATVAEQMVERVTLGGMQTFRDAFPLDFPESYLDPI